MAAVESMGEVDEMHSKGEGDIITNGEVANDVDIEESKVKKPLQQACENELEEDGVQESEAEPKVDGDDKEADKEDGESSGGDKELGAEGSELVDASKELNNDEEAKKSDAGEETKENNVTADEEDGTNDGPSSEVDKDASENPQSDASKSNSASVEDSSIKEKEDAQEAVEGTSDKNDLGNLEICVKDVHSVVEGDGESTDVAKKESVKQKDIIEIHEILDDDDDDEMCGSARENGPRTPTKAGKPSTGETIELNDSGDTDGEGDVMIVEPSSPKENGAEKRKASEPLEIIDLESTPVKKPKVDKQAITPRRSSRNLNKQKSYVESDKEEEEEEAKKKSESEESDIEEVLPEDPLAVMDAVSLERVVHPKPTVKPSSNAATIVVKDTKKLVEIASKSNASNMSSGKKEPTLVIIDTNSILSGRGPVPIVTKPPKPAVSKPATVKPAQIVPSVSSQPSQVNISHSNYPTILPMALPAQGMYPPNMRATITPIPINTSHAPPVVPKPVPPVQQPPPLLPTLTDDMFVVEAPSFIVPYVYEKPPKKEFKEFIQVVVKEIEEQRKKEEEEEEEEAKAEGEEKSDDKEKEKDEKAKEGEDKAKKTDDEQTSDKDKASQKEPENQSEKKPEEVEKVDTPTKVDGEKPDAKKPYSYFESPLGKFFIDIGLNLVQEFVQSDLLKQQKRKRDREGGQNSETNKTIQSLIKNLEYTKESNMGFKMPLKKCEYCHFKTESALVLAHHLEIPHMKNYVYKCNFCAYEVRSPHDILFHMEAEHAVKGHLERALSFHQCSNCPFEDNQKGKLSRHLVACARKFKPERNLEPPIDWEPPAKIPRVPKMRQQGLNATAAAYQAMSKTSQYQFLSKMQLQSTNALQRGRGRPNMTPPAKNQPIIRPGTGMVYKQTMSGGSVLVPTNYQLSGNQVFQVLGQELGGRLGHPGHMAFLPHMPSASSTFSSMQQQQSPQNQVQKKPVHQPSISITPLPRASTSAPSPVASKPGDTNAKNSFVICEICDGYIKDLEQLRNHMQWIHKIKIHPKMIYNRPPLNCQKCQFRFFTDQGLERHLLGSHGLVTSSMQDAANKSKDAGRCPVCGRVYQWKLLNHVARDHNMTLKPAHLSYKCTVCTATFGMYKQFENHVYSAHSVVAKRVMDKKGTNSSPSSNSSKNDLMKPLKINDEITIIPQPNKSSNGAGTSKEGSPASTGSTNSRNSTPGTSKNAENDSSSASSRAERLARRTANADADAGENADADAEADTDGDD